MINTDRLDSAVLEMQMALTATIREIRTALANLPKPDDPAMAEILTELAAANVDIDGHHSRFPGEHKFNGCTDAGYPRCERCNDWDRVYDRNNAAIDAITKYALAINLEKEK